MNAYSLGILLSIVVYVIIGNYVGRKVKRLDQYFVAGRNAPTLLIVGTLVASFLSTAAFLGETGFAYDGYACLLLILTVINASGYILGALFFGRFVRRSGTLTVPEYFGRRFNSRSVQTVAGLTVAVGITAYLLGVTKGASLLVSEISGISYGVSLILVWAGYTIFTMYAGSQGVVITDTIMFVLFTLVAFTAVPYVMGAAGGWFESISALAVYDQKPGIISWHGLNGAEAYWNTPIESLTWALLLGLAWGGVVAVSPWQTSRYLMAKSENVVIRSACIAAVLLLFLYVALASMGAAINLSNPALENGEKAMIWAATNLMPTPMGVLLIAGIVAAALSSCSTFLSIIGFSVSNDLHPPGEDESGQLRISRLAMLATGLIALSLAYYQPPSIMWIVYFAGTVFASSWGPIAFLSVWCRWVTAEAAFWSILLGFVANVAAKLLEHYGLVALPVYLDPFIIGLLFSLGSAVTVSCFTRPSKEAVDYFEQLHVTPREECDVVEVKRTLRWPKVVVASGLAIIAFMIAFYAVPYNQAIMATQPCAAGADSIACMSGGELILAVWYGLPTCLLGILVYRQVKKYYVRD